eukprot:NODE_8_length_47770_cov_0.334354.p22 type:complete len:123 gc:universal NODE_8_length_47770_cov_0.334354:15733-15365(-)
MSAVKCLSFSVLVNISILDVLYLDASSFNIETPFSFILLQKPNIRIDLLWEMDFFSKNLSNTVFPYDKLPCEFKGSSDENKIISFLVAISIEQPALFKSTLTRLSYIASMFLFLSTLGGEPK